MSVVCVCVYADNRQRAARRQQQDVELVFSPSPQPPPSLGANSEFARPVFRGRVCRLRSPPAPLSAPLGPGLRGRVLENALILYARRLRFWFWFAWFALTLEVGGSRFEWFVMAGLSKGLHQYVTSLLSPGKHAWVDEKAGQAQGLRREEGGGRRLTDCLRGEERGGCDQYASHGEGIGG